MTRFTNIDDPNNSISWSNDLIMNIWAEYVSNKLEEQFEVITNVGKKDEVTCSKCGSLAHRMLTGFTVLGTASTAGSGCSTASRTTGGWGGG